MGRDYTFMEMKRTLAVGWGGLGERVADAWYVFNTSRFGGRLSPLPIFLTPTSPYGSWFGQTCVSDEVTHIALVSPRVGNRLVADLGTLLHEMIHQHLREQGLCSKHSDQPWCDEIMRLHFEITGERLWAGKYTVAKEKLPCGARRSMRTNRPDPETGRPSLTQAQIARWPRSVGLDLGKLRQ